jgi:Amidohydrolase
VGLHAVRLAGPSLGSVAVIGGGAIGIAAAVAAIRLRPNVMCKISGLGMGDPRWTVDSLRPMVEHLLESFGDERCFFGSNRPVDRLLQRRRDRRLPRRSSPLSRPKSSGRSSPGAPSAHVPDLIAPPLLSSAVEQNLYLSGRGVHQLIEHDVGISQVDRRGDHLVDRNRAVRQHLERSGKVSSRASSRTPHLNLVNDETLSVKANVARRDADHDEAPLPPQQAGGHPRRGGRPGTLDYRTGCGQTTIRELALQVLWLQSVQADLRRDRDPGRITIDYEGVQIRRCANGTGRNEADRPSADHEHGVLERHIKRTCGSQADRDWLRQSRLARSDARWDSEERGRVSDHRLGKTALQVEPDQLSMVATLDALVLVSSLTKTTAAAVPIDQHRYLIPNRPILDVRSTCTDDAGELVPEDGACRHLAEHLKVGPANPTEPDVDTDLSPPRGWQIPFSDGKSMIGRYLDDAHEGLRDGRAPTFGLPGAV